MGRARRPHLSFFPHNTRRLQTLPEAAGGGAFGEGGKATHTPNPPACTRATFRSRAHAFGVSPQRAPPTLNASGGRGGGRGQWVARSTTTGEGALGERRTLVWAAEREKKIEASEGGREGAERARERPHTRVETLGPHGPANQPTRSPPRPHTHTPPQVSRLATGGRQGGGGGPSAVGAGPLRHQFWPRVACLGTRAGGTSRPTSLAPSLRPRCLRRHRRARPLALSGSGTNNGARCVAAFFLVRRPQLLPPTHTHAASSSNSHHGRRVHRRRLHSCTGGGRCGAG